MTQPTKEQQKIYIGFKKLREEQQALVSELSRYSSEARETRSVLNSVDKEENDHRKFYYRAVDALLELDKPSIVAKLKSNIAELDGKIQALDGQVKSKGVELQEYTEKHKVRIVSQ